MENQINVDNQNAQQVGQNSINQSTQIQENQIIQDVKPPTSSFRKQRIAKFLIVTVISSLIVIFLTLPIVKVISRFPLFQQINFFPGMAESYAIIPSLILIFMTTLTVIKITLKKWKYVLVGFLVMFLTIISMFLIGSYRTNKFFRGLHRELNQSIDMSKQAQITLTNFEELPGYDSSQKLVNISFKINFISNTTADMNITPKIRFKGQHINGNEFLFWFDPTEIIYDNKSEPYSYKSFYQIEANKPHEMVFTFNDLSKGVEYMSDKPGYFEVGIIYSGHTSDPLGYGQGNATLINNIIDQTGKSVKEEFAWEVLHFISNEYKLKSP